MAIDPTTVLGRTDDGEIATIARNESAEIVRRPHEISGATAVIEIDNCGITIR